VQATVHGDAARTVLFARMDLAVNCASIVLQATTTALLLRRAGITATLCLLPVVTLAGFAALAVHPTLALVVGFQIVRRTVDYFAARPARELCFVVVGREEKYAAKSFIDTFVYRGADAVGAGTFGVAAAAVPIIAIPLCLVWLGVAIFLGGRQRRLSASSSASATP
jgi:AAA family ATP:ADP antiporter